MSVLLTKFYCFSQDIGQKVHNLNTDSLYVCWTNTQPALTNTVYSNITDLTTGGGYTAGGAQLTGNAYSQISGVSTLTASNLTFTATTGFGPFRYAVLYNNTSSTKALIGYWDYGSSITLGASEIVTVNDSSGILTVQ